MQVILFRISLESDPKMKSVYASSLFVRWQKYHKEMRKCLKKEVKGTNKDGVIHLSSGQLQLCPAGTLRAQAGHGPGRSPP